MSYFAKQLLRLFISLPAGIAPTRKVGIGYVPFSQHFKVSEADGILSAAMDLGRAEVSNFHICFWQYKKQYRKGLYFYDV